MTDRYRIQKRKRTGLRDPGPDNEWEWQVIDTTTGQAVDNGKAHASQAVANVRRRALEDKELNRQAAALREQKRKNK